jgi:hypothetical protein
VGEVVDVSLSLSCHGVKEVAVSIPSTSFHHGLGKRLAASDASFFVHPCLLYEPSRKNNDAGLGYSWLI